MFSLHIADAIDRAGSSAIGEIKQAIWQAYRAGGLTDEEAQALAERAEARQTILQRLILNKPTAPKERRVKRPDRIQHRRKLAASAPLPPQLAAHFTIGELSVLRIVGDECRDRGTCDRCLAELAARAGVGKSTVRNALRTAARLGLLTMQERRRRGQRSLTNVVTIVSREWRLWQQRARKPSQGVGPEKRMPMDTRYKQGAFNSPVASVATIPRAIGGCGHAG